MRTEAQKRAENKSKKKIYEQLLVKSRREFRLDERITHAAERTGMSKNAYMVAAIERQLEADGFGRDALPCEDAPG